MFTKMIHKFLQKRCARMSKIKNNISEEAQNSIDLWEGLGGMLGNQNGNLVGFLKAGTLSDLINKRLWEDIEKHKDEILPIVGRIIGNGEWVEIDTKGKSVKDIIK